MKKLIEKAKTKLDERGDASQLFKNLTELKNESQLVKNLTELKDDPFKSLKFPSLRRLIYNDFGYPLEKYVYQTEDGYINSVYRIPGPKGTKEG